MSQEQEKLWCTHDQSTQKLSKTQDVTIAQALKCIREVLHMTSSPPMADNQEEVLNANSQGCPDECPSTSTASMTSFSIPDDSSSSDEDTPKISRFLSYNLTMCRDPLDLKVAVLVDFLLNKYKNKEQITEEDMVNTVFRGQYKGNIRGFRWRASQCLEEMFGLDLREVDPISHRYDLVIKLGLTYDGLLTDEDGVPKTGILIHILGLIFMKNNKATEEQVWKSLKVWGIHSEQQDFIFGDVKKLITNDLVQEKYLEYQLVPNSDPPRYEFLWGPRAYAETTKMKVLEFVAKVDESPPKYFRRQYEEALKDEEERRTRAIAAARPRNDTKGHASSNMVSKSTETPFGLLSVIFPD